MDELKNELDQLEAVKMELEKLSSVADALYFSLTREEINHGRLAGCADLLGVELLTASKNLEDAIDNIYQIIRGEKA